MKIKGMLCCFLFACVAFGLTACGSPSTLKASFEKEEYVLSFGDSVDFRQNFSCSGFELDSLTFAFSNSSIFESLEDGSYQAKGYGSSEVFAYVDNEVVATASAFVKSAFSQPQNITISESGVISWQDSFVIYEGEQIKATSYLLTINEQEFEVRGTTYAITEKGVYNVTVQALGSEEDRVDLSPKSEKVTLYYGVMPQPQNVQMSVSSAFGSQSVTLTWQGDESALYRIAVDGIVLQEELRGDGFQIDFSFQIDLTNYSDNDMANVVITAIDPTGEKRENSISVQLEKLETPQTQYFFDGQDGFLRFSQINGASKYIIHASSTSGVKDITIEQAEASGGYISTYLPELESGVYEITLQAVGGEKEGIFYGSSNISTMSTFAKIQTPAIETAVDGKTLTISVQADGYTTDYLVQVGEKTFSWDVNSSPEKEISLENFSAGQYEVKVYALPTFLEGNVVEYPYGEEEYKNVLRSSYATSQIYVLEEIGKITSSVEDKTVTLSFPEVANADRYTLLLGGEDLLLESDIADGQVTFVIEDLSLYAPEDNEYIFTIIADREDGQGSRVSANKTLTILDTVTQSQEQENGYFSWDILATEEGSVEYSYQIFSSNSDYSSVGELVASGRTNTGKTNDILPDEGYYIIQITSVSLDGDTYLDSNFYDSEKIFQTGFRVTQKIETPQVTFISKDGKNQLQVQSVYFATQYDIYINDSLDGTLLLTTDKVEEGAVGIYTIANNFANSGEYTIKVVAKSGEYDKNIYLDSDPKEIFVAKSTQPIFDTQIEYDKKGNKTTEKMVVAQNDYAGGVEIFYEGSLVGNEYEYSLLSYNGVFDLTLHYTAKPSEGDKYYLNSNDITYSFKRLEIPQAIVYSNGKVTFTNQDSQFVEYYKVAVILANENNGDQVFLTECEEESFDLEGFITSMCEQNQTFNSAYLQCEYIGVEISAYANTENDNVYLLPSGKGKTSLGQSTLVVSKLDSPKIAFDREKMTLSWEEVGQSDGTNRTYYDVYVGGKIFKEEHATNSIVLSAEDDFEIEKGVYVVAKNSGYLDSARSNEIFIRRLAQVSTLQISFDQTNGWIATISISGQDQNFVERVLVAGDNENVVYTKGENSATIMLGKFPQTFTITKEAVEKETSYLDGERIYLSSNETTYTFTDITSLDLGLTLKEGKAVWNDIAPSWLGVQEKPLSYSLIVFEGEREIARIENIEGNEYILDNLSEQVVGGIASGKYSIQVEAEISDYTISYSSSGTSGYYGKGQSEKVSVSKLSKVDNAQISLLEDEEITNLAQRKSLANVVLTWQENSDWQGQDVSFKISVGENVLPVLKNGSQNDLLSLVLTEGQYILTLDNSYFVSGENEIAIIVTSLTAMTSDMFTTSVYRYSTPQIAVDDSGLLTIESAEEDKGGSFTFKLHFMANNDDNVVDEYRDIESIDGSATYDLTKDLFVGVKGAYTIEVVVFDEDGQELSNKTLGVIEGYRLSGVTKVEIADDGGVTITLASDAPSGEDVIFTARLVKEDEVLFEGQFFPTQSEKPQEYFYSLLDFVNLVKGENLLSGQLDFLLTVSQKGNVRAEFYPFSFIYQTTASSVKVKRAQTMAEDYIFIEALAEDDGTTAFDVRVFYTTYEEVEEEDGLVIKKVENEIRKTYLSDDASIKGYWTTPIASTRAVVSDGDYSKNGYFSYDFVEGRNNIQGWAINFADLLKDIVYGKIEIQISRISYDESASLYVQHSTASQIVQKLMSPQLSQNKHFDESYIARITWQWSQQFDPETEEPLFPMTSGYYVYIYEVNSTNQSFVTRLLSNTTYVDIDDYLTNGKSYAIYLQAVSTSEGVIASNRVSVREIKKYGLPQSVVIENGVIKFSTDLLQGLDLTKMIENLYNQGNFFTQLSSTTFYSPFEFNLNTISSLQVRLKFSNATGQYYATLPGYQLFDFSNVTIATNEGQRVNFLTAIDNMLKSGSADSSSASYITVKTFHELLTNANRGYADQGLLFDDYGEAIPAGEYQIALVQAGNPNGGYIQSRPSEQKISGYVNASPSYYLDHQDIEGESKIHYRISFSTVASKNWDGTKVEDIAVAGQYIMRWQADNGDKIVFKIINEGDNSSPNWQIYYLYNNREISIDGAIVQSARNGYVTIDVTNIVLSGEVTTLQRQKYSVAIFASGNSYAINGKNEEMSLTLLGFEPSNISFSDGVFSWTAPSGGENNLTRVVYKKSLQQARTEELSFTNGKASLDFLPDDGLYDYIIFSVLGTYSNATKTMSVESESYIIKNVYKLHAPDMTVYGNEIHLQTNSADKAEKDDLKLRISNDVARENEVQDLYFTTEIVEGDKYIYQAGLLNFAEQSEYKVTEKDASQFYAFALGNSSAVVSTKNNEGDMADYTLVLENGENAILSSNESQINARMLAETASAQVQSESGDLQWATNEGDEIGQEYTVYNKVIVEIILNGSASANEQRIYYSQSNVLDVDVFGITDEGTKFDVTIQKVVFAKGSSADYDEISVEGNYLKYASATFTDGSYILASDYAKSEVRFERQIAVDSVEVKNGAIYVKSTFGYSTLDIFARSNDGMEMKLEGEFSQVGIGTNEYKFTIKEGQFVGSNPYTISVVAKKDTKSQEVNIIKSNPVSVNPVYKLSTPKQGDFALEYDIENEWYVLDFDSYIDSNLFSQDNQCYAVEISINGTKLNYRIGNGREDDVYQAINIRFDEQTTEIIQELPNENGLPLITIPANEKIEIAFKVVDVQGVDYSPKKNLLDGDTATFVIGSADWATNIEGTVIDTFSWQENSKSFEWTFANAGNVVTENAQIFTFDGNIPEVAEGVSVSQGDNLVLNDESRIYENVVYRGFTQEGNRYFIKESDLLIGNVEFLIGVSYINSNGDIYEVENAITTNLFYQPKMQGRIAKAEVRVRLKNTISLYSQPLLYENEVDFNLFAGGDGTAENPYQIATGEQFENIKYRNTAGQMVYFKQMGDIEVSLTDFLATTFYGSYNGNGYLLTLNFSGEQNLDTLRLSVMGVGREFNSGISLFENIDESASITSVRIAYSVKYSSSNSFIFAPIALTSYGTIRNVNVINATYDISSSAYGTNHAFGGMVALNYGKISDCENSTTSNLQMQSTGNVDVFFGGITLANLALGNDYVGTITRAINSGDKTFVMTRANSNLFVAGISLSNNSTTTQSGNNGGLTASGNGTFNATIAGVVLSNNTGKVLYSYNNSSKISSTSTANIAGVIYASYSGSYGEYLVDSAGLAVVSQATGMDAKFCYGIKSVQNAVTVNQITSINTSCNDNGHRLLVTADESAPYGYTASIS